MLSAGVAIKCSQGYEREFLGQESLTMSKKCFKRVQVVLQEKHCRNAWVFVFCCVGVCLHVFVSVPSLCLRVFLSAST